MKLLRVISAFGTAFTLRTILLAALLFALRKSDAQTFTTLHLFTGGAGDGSQPSAGLVQGKDGFLYGTTYSGGNEGEGTVFRIRTNSPYMVTLMHTFLDVEGYEPESGLVQASNGSLYGTTYDGTTDLAEAGYGTVFRISTNGPAFVLTNLVNFSNTNGNHPLGSLVQAPDGFFYGTTSSGGTNGSGLLFRMSADGTVTVLHYFSGGADGGEPDDGVILGKDGYLYGTAYDGGGDGVGTVFQVSTNAPYTFTTMHSFAYTDGGYPQGGLAQGQDGFLYGTTTMGGADGDGVVFRISTNGPEFAFTVLYSFSGGNDGATPSARLIQGTDGYLYGTTYSGGANDDGTVFRISTNGPAFTLATLHSFSGSSDGSSPSGPLVEGSDGNFYGTTSKGGVENNGTVFRIGGTNPPALGPGCPEDITTAATSASGAVVTFNLVTNGGCPPVSVTAVPPSGGTFAIGTNTVEVTATDSCGQEVHCSFSVIVTPLPSTNSGGIAVGPLAFNPQTGLYQQTVTFSNTLTTSDGSSEGLRFRATPVAISAVRISVLGLPSDVSLYNASGASDGVPYVEYDQTIPAGGSVTFLLEYYEASRAAFVSTNFVATVVPAATIPTPTGTVLQLDQNQTFLSQGELTIEFASVPGRAYVVQYSSDMKTWLTAAPPIVAKNNKTQWVDSGPPKTESPPGPPGQRFYRVVQTN